MSTLPDSLAEIIAEFAELEQPDRLMLLLEFGQELPPIPAAYAAARDRMERVEECQTPLFLAVELGNDGAVHLLFDAPAEAPTTRGFAGILHAGLDGLPAEQVLAVPEDFPNRLGLTAAVSPLRLRGLSAMLSRVKRQVREQAA